MEDIHTLIFTCVIILTVAYVVRWQIDPVSSHACAGHELTCLYDEIPAPQDTHTRGTFRSRSIVPRSVQFHPEWEGTR